MANLGEDGEKWGFESYAVLYDDDENEFCEYANLDDAKKDVNKIIDEGYTNVCIEKRYRIYPIIERRVIW